MLTHGGFLRRDWARSVRSNLLVEGVHSITDVCANAGIVELMLTPSYALNRHFHLLPRGPVVQYLGQGAFLGRARSSCSARHENLLIVAKDALDLRKCRDLAKKGLEFAVCLHR